MRIEEVPSGSRVAIDANILIYHFTGVSPESSNFLRRCESGELTGFVSTSILAEMLHRLMILEALDTKAVSGGNPVRRLRETPQRVCALTRYLEAEEALLRVGLTFMEVNLETFGLARQVRRQHGLLINDSLLVGTMLQFGLNLLATADHDFERLAVLTPCYPGDLPKAAA